MADSTQTTQYQTGFAPQIAPYAESLLGQAQAYTDVNQNPYQAYTGNRVAQYSPLQQQSYDYAKQMQSAPQLGDATALAGQAGLGGLNAQYSYNPSSFDSATAKSMMNPYTQNVVDMQKQQAMRDSAIARQGQQAQAVNAGAFGGARDAIMRNQGSAELQRNLAGIQATGLNNAYTQAQNQYNTQYGQNAQQQQFGAGLGMQGLGLANQSASNLGALGQTQYGQNMGITGLQNQFGLQQQQQAQNIANTKYEDFQNAQNYPFKQMGFMSDIVRGLPTSTTASTMFQAAPTAIQNIASLGLGAAGISKLMANGGMVNSYANGGSVGFDNGGSVFSPSFKQYAVEHIDPRQLPIAQRNAQARGDFDTNQYAMEQMAEDAALRRGIAPAVPQGFDMVRAAGGGILGFAGGSKIPSQDELMQMALQDRPQQTPDQYEANVTRGAETLSKLYGADPTLAFSKEMADQRKQYQGGLSDFDKGMIMLQMAGAVVDPSAGGNTMRGFGLASNVGGKAGAAAMAQNKQADRDLLRSQVELSSAQQNRKEGRINAAAAHEDKAQALEANAFESKRSAAEKLAQILSTKENTAATIQSHVAPFLQVVNDLARDPRNEGKSREDLMAMASKAMYGSQYANVDQRSLNTYLTKKNEIEKQFNTFSALPKNNPLRIEKESERDRQLLDLKRRFPGADDVPSGSIASGLPQGGSMRDRGFRNLGPE